MKKKIFFAVATIVAAVSVGYAAYLSQRVGMTDTLLENIEALADEEDESKSAEVIERTWQEGPFYTGTGENTIEYYWVYTLTECYGDGVIDCEYNLTGERKETSK
ncbi:MAG: hypothetical protein J6C87_08955 [Bacteroides sp.]|nr:hypothetical protein [Bacteroides sp.]